MPSGSCSYSTAFYNYIRYAVAIQLGMSASAAGDRSVYPPIGKGAVPPHLNSVPSWGSRAASFGCM